jgi:hypothetical protein
VELPRLGLRKSARGDLARGRLSIPVSSHRHPSSELSFPRNPFSPSLLGPLLISTEPKATGVIFNFFSLSFFLRENPGGLVGLLLGSQNSQGNRERAGVACFEKSPCCAGNARRPFAIGASVDPPLPGQPRSTIWPNSSILHLEPAPPTAAARLTQRPSSGPPHWTRESGRKCCLLQPRG